MRKLLKWIEAAFAAAAFAEEGEVETARRILAESGSDDPAAGAAPCSVARPREFLRPGKIARSP